MKEGLREGAAHKKIPKSGATRPESPSPQMRDPRLRWTQQYRQKESGIWTGYEK